MWVAVLAATAVGGLPASAETAVYQVAASEDDTYTVGASNNVAYTRVIWPYTSDLRRSFLRWAIDIPAGATIESAAVEVCADATSANPGTVRLQLLDDDSCPAFNTSNPHDWSVTGVAADWTLDPWTAGQWYTSCDLTDIVQAFMDRPNYVPGNYLGLRAVAVPTSISRWARSWDYAGNASGAKLIVVYSVPSGNIAPVAHAGHHQTMLDLDNSGAEVVGLYGTFSFDEDGTIASYVWMEGATQIATGANALVNLAAGTHDIKLVVTDDDGATDEDTATVTVRTINDPTWPPTTIPVYTPENVPPTPTVNELWQTNAVTYCGVTWTFDRVAPVGRFVTGDYYVVGPVVVTSITPGWDGVKNGSALNYQSNNNKWSAFDTRVRSIRYKADLRIDVPINMSPGDILISSVGMRDGAVGVEPFWGKSQSGSPIRSYSVLHCLTAPVPPDAFRPGYTDTTQTIYLARNLNRALLPTLDVGTTNYAWPLRDNMFAGLTTTNVHEWALLFERPWVDMCEFGFDAPLEYMPGYGHLLIRVQSMISLILASDLSAEDKEKLLIGFVQYGIDTWGLVRGGYPGWPGFGGHYSGRKWPIVLAGVLLGDPDMACPTQSYPDCLFSEDTQTLYDDGWTGARVVFGGHQHGLGLDYWLDPPPGETRDRGPYEHNAPETWTSWGFLSESYRRCCTSNAWVGYALVIQLMQLEDQWDHDAFFDYCDRWMYEDNAAMGVLLQQGFELNPDPYYHDGFTFPSFWLPPKSYRAMEAFVNTVWDTYRPTINKPLDGWMQP